MKRYSAYKPSGVEWIGDIPEKWKTMKLKHVLSDYQDGTHASYKRVLSDYPLLSAKNVFEDGIKITDEESTISESDFKSIVSNGFPKQGDVAICCVGTIGRCCLYTLSEPQAFQRSVTFLRTNRKILNNYLVYLMRSDIANPQYIMYAKTSAQSGIYMETLVNFKIVLPPKDEQVAIAAYLDAKCAKIDNVLSVQQKRIELLKELKQSIITNAVTKGLDKNVEFKPSGIEWIGDIPEKWETKRLKYVGTARNGLTYDQSDVVEEGVLVLRSSNIQDGKLDYNDKVYVKRVSDELMVKSGDIIICSRNGSLSLVGKCAYIDKDINASFGAFMLRFRGNLHSRYSYYLLSQTISQYKGLFSTTTVNQLTLDTLNNMWVAIPPKDEQIIIASYLNKKCSAIDNQISKIERQIELLKEYKQSIITECVTGKRKVC